MPFSCLSNALSLSLSLSTSTMHASYSDCLPVGKSTKLFTIRQPLMFTLKLQGSEDGYRKKAHVCRVEGKEDGGGIQIIGKRAPAVDEQQGEEEHGKPHKKRIPSSFFSLTRRHCRQELSLFFRVHEQRNCCQHV